MAQKTAWTGAALSESDINTYLMHEGGAWTTYTPTLTQSVAVTKTVTSAVYARAGRLITFEVLLTVTGAGTAANAVVIGLPVTAAGRYGSTGIRFGVGSIIDTSATLEYYGPLVSFTTTTVLIKAASAAAPTGVLGGVTFTAGLAVGDNVMIAGVYEAAT